ARRQLESNAEAVAASLEGAAKELDLALEELRELARGLHPAALTEQGLGPALEGVANRLPIEVDVSAPAERLPENIEATAYYIVSEALTNVAKHAQATEVRAVVRPLPIAEVGVDVVLVRERRYVRAHGCVEVPEPA